MTMVKSMLAGALAGLLMSGAAFAQSVAPAAPPAMMPGAAAPAMDKKAVTKACLAEATSQGLHGKPRKAFRRKCRREKMKGM